MSRSATSTQASSGRSLLVVGLLVALVAAYTSLPAVAQSTVDVEDLGTTIDDFLVLDSVLGDDGEGNPVLYTSTYVVNPVGVHVAGVDPVTGEVVRGPHLMPGTWGPYHMDRGTDGRIYMAPLTASGQGQVWVYDPVTDSVELAVTLAGEQLFGLAASPWGTIFAGGLSTGTVWEYDPSDGSVTDHGRLGPNGYAKALLPLEGNRLLVGAGAPATLTVTDLDTGVTTDVLPPEFAGYSFAYNVARVGDTVFVQMNVPDIKLALFDAGTLDYLGTAFGDDSAHPEFSPTGTGVTAITDTRYYLTGTDGATGESGVFVHDLATDELAFATPADWAGARLWPVELDGETWITSIGILGQWARWNPVTGETVASVLPLPGAPTNITALETGPDGRVYGGTYETNAMFAWDPEADELEVFGNVAPGRSGEILSMASTTDRLYIGSYTHNVVTVFDPALPWEPGTSTGSNPIELGEVGDQQYRPWDMTVGSDGRVYVVSSAAYGILGGALSAIDPETLEVSSWRYLAGDQHLFSVAAGEGVLYLGTTIYGDNTNAGGQARLLVFDVESEQVVADVVPVANHGGRMRALVTSPEGLVIGSVDSGHWFTYDPATGEATDLGAFPFGTINTMLVGRDGLIYGHTGSAVFRVDPSTLEVTQLTGVGGGYYRTLAVDRDGRLYWPSGANLLRTADPVMPAAPTCDTTIAIDGEDTGVADWVEGDGCASAALRADGEWESHGAFVDHVDAVTEGWLEAGLVTGAERGAIVAAAARSSIGR